MSGITPARRQLKGVAEAVAVIVGLAVLSIAVSYVLVYIYLPAIQRAEASALRPQVSENLVLFIAEVNNTKVLTVKNVGSVTSRIEYTVVLDNTTYSKYVVDLAKSNLCNWTSRTLAPGEVTSIACSGGFIPVAVVTGNGAVFAIDERLFSLLLEKSTSIPMTTVYGGVMLKTTQNLLTYLENATILYEGAVNTSLAMKKVLEYSEPRTGLVGYLNASLVLVGNDPVSGKLNVLVVGFGTGSNLTVTPSNGTSTSISLGDTAKYRFRLKVEGFSGYLNTSIGIQACYIDNGKPCTIAVNGVADHVVVYGSSNTSGGVLGLDPYVFVGDLDGNGNVEVVFVTEDFNVGDSSVVNDYVPGNQSISVVDVSVKPLRLVFSNVPVDSGKYSMAVLSMRMFFWDNSLDDISDNDNRVIVRVGLYSNETKSFVYSTQLSYYELNRYRNVKPFSASRITKDFLIPVPKTGEVYYIAVEIVDPFYLENKRNDADIILGIEYIGILLSGE